MSLFRLHNVFDDVSVTLDTESEAPEGPFTVSLRFGSGSIAPEADNETHEFDTLREAVEKFNELALNEFQAVLDDGSFS